MKWWRIRKVANAATWEMLFFGAGMIAGILVATSTVGLLSPRPLSLDATPAELADLSLQQSMTMSSWWMVAISTLSCLVGGASLYLIARTLFEAKRSATAAEGTITITREIGEAQVRAYLDITEVALERSSAGLPMVVVSARNTGQSPAQHLVAYISVRMTDETMDVQADLTGALQFEDVPAGGTGIGRKALMFRTIGDPIDNHRYSLFVDIELKFNDVFNRSRSLTNFYFCRYSGDEAKVTLRPSST